MVGTLAWGQDTDVKVNANGKVSVGSKGKDVRDVLYDLFSQSKRSFVLDPGVKFNLYLNLFEVDFDKALDVVVTAADLGYDLNGGIYYIGKNKPKPASAGRTNSTTASKGTSEGGTETSSTVSPQEQGGKGKVTDAELQKHLTTRLSMTDIRAVFGEFTRQTGIKVIAADDVPKYKVDAFLINTSLKYAMDTITKAAGLKYTRTMNKELLVEVAKKG